MLKRSAPRVEDAREAGVHGSAAGSAEPLRIGSLAVRRPVLLAPLSGITDVPFRRLVRSFGTELVYSEMVASGEYVKGEAESLLRAGRDGGAIHAVQLAGREPGAMGEAARRLADAGADLIDINMGCPAKKVVGGQSGSALMRDLDLASRIVAATVEGAGDVPVTLKMRLGWDRATMNAPDLARRAEALGVRLVTVHGRTRDQFYEGRADWAAIAAVRAAVRIPLVANGDLVRGEDAPAMLRESGADGLMIGRGACGRPWFPALVAGHLAAGDLGRIGLRELVVAHYDAMLGHYGEAVGVRHARKHLGWYLDLLAPMRGAALAGDRAAILGERDPTVVCRRLSDLFGALTAADVETGAAALRRAA